MVNELLSIRRDDETGGIETHLAAPSPDELLDICVSLCICMEDNETFRKMLNITWNLYNTDEEFKNCIKTKAVGMPDFNKLLKNL